MSIKAIVLAGPTAVGKTEYSIGIAKRFDCEIVSCDSMQLYKYMDIGSAKPSRDELGAVPHHLIGVIDPREEFSVAKYQRLAKAAIYDISQRGKIPMICGGTGLYLDSLLYDMDFAGSNKDKNFRAAMERIALNEGAGKLYQMLQERDPEASLRIHPNNIKRVIRALEANHQGKSMSSFECVVKQPSDIEPVMIGLVRDREELYERINKRVDILVQEGLVDEVRSLLDMGLKYEDISMKGIGYKEIIEYLQGKVTLDEAICNVKRNTRHYAKRQMTWLRRYDNIKWFDLSATDGSYDVAEEICEWLEKRL